MRTNRVLTQLVRELTKIKSRTPNTIPFRNRELNHCVLSFTTTTPNDEKIYLHIGPGGDCWIGEEIFAAKHNQTGYVKSIVLNNIYHTNYQQKNIGTKVDKGSLLIEILEDHPEWAQEIYDTESFPETLLHHFQSELENDSKF